MNDKHNSLESRSKTNRLSYTITSSALLLALILSIVSWMNLCTEACVEEHNYRLFGFSFEEIGLVFFPSLLLIHLLSLYYPLMDRLTSYSLCAAFGAEVMFVYAQKFIIGSWCPLCLGIAASVAIAGISHLYPEYAEFKTDLKHKNKGYNMNIINRYFFGTVFLFLGFVLAFTGLGKENQLEAAESTVKENLMFGSGKQSVVVYVFTDWRCPACRSLEPVFESIMPKIYDKADLVFVDDPVHPESMNFIPYNLSFVIHNKSKYFQLRNGLIEISKKTKVPSEADVEALAASQGVSYIQLDYADVALANLYFEELIKKFDIEGTPIVVVATKHNKKSIKLSGKSEISEESILKAVDKLSAK